MRSKRHLSSINKDIEPVARREIKLITHGFRQDYTSLIIQLDRQMHIRIIGPKATARRSKLYGLRHDLFNHARRLHTGELLVQPLVLVGKPLVVDAE